MLQVDDALKDAHSQLLEKDKVSATHLSLLADIIIYTGVDTASDDAG